MPAYFFDPYRYRAYKMKGGTFQNYPDKSYLQLTDDQIAKHLNGEQVVGLYPLLSDNTSWFIAADFDEGDWIASELTTDSGILIPLYLSKKILQNQ